MWFSLEIVQSLVESVLMYALYDCACIRAVRLCVYMCCGRMCVVYVCAVRKYALVFECVLRVLLSVCVCARAL